MVLMVVEMHLPKGVWRWLRTKPVLLAEMSSQCITALSLYKAA